MCGSVDGWMPTDRVASLKCSSNGAGTRLTLLQPLRSSPPSASTEADGEETEPTHATEALPLAFRGVCVKDADGAESETSSDVDVKHGDMRWDTGDGSADPKPNKPRGPNCLPMRSTPEL
mmetsp:Transcript_120584/g.300829  ORF Transcript_120584/g.300829 Transcript_120584/m.300829 type:complete len:120 (+) Transcript_120584:218-577(+)